MTEPAQTPPGPAVPNYRRRRAIALTALLAAALVPAITVAGCRHSPSNATAARPNARAIATTPRPEKTTPAPDDDAARIDATLARMPLVAIGSTRGRRIALTFDDGPSPYTAKIMRTLKRYHVPATFFWLGSSARDDPGDAWEQLLDGPWVIGDHTQGHLNLRDRTRREEAADIDDGATRLRWVTGKQPRLFRPPYGQFDRDTLDLLRRRNMLMVLWSVDSEDYERPGTADIVHNVVSGAKPGAIILMHDGGGDRTETIAALPRIIKQLKAKHYRFVTVPTLLKDPAPLHQPQYTIDH